jgi:predicted DNA-binding transcriptional regulator YafY
MPSTTTQRALRLLSLLQTGRRWTAPELAQAMGVPPRTLRRDLDRLREMGYPIISTRGPGGHYALEAGDGMPPLMFDDDEAVATMLALRLADAGQAGVAFDTAAAERARTKLRRFLPTALRHRTDGVLATMDVARSTVDPTSDQELSHLASAITEHRVVHFDHIGKRGRSTRTVEPARLVHVRDRWYLHAWDPARTDWRSFRLDRLHDLQVTARAFLPRPLPEDVASLLQDQFFGSPPVHVVLTLQAGMEESATRLMRVDGSLTPTDPLHTRYDAYVDSFEWLAVVLTFADLEFTVEEPQEFAHFIAATGTRLARGGTSHDVR